MGIILQPHIHHLPHVLHTWLFTFNHVVIGKTGLPGPPTQQNNSADQLLHLGMFNTNHRDIGLPFRWFLTPKGLQGYWNPEHLIQNLFPECKDFL